MNKEKEYTYWVGVTAGVVAGHLPNIFNHGWIAYVMLTVAVLQVVRAKLRKDDRTN